MSARGSDRPPRRPWLRVLPLVLLATLSLAILASGASHFLSLDEILASRAWLAAAVSQDPARAMAVAFSVYVASVVVSIPASLFLTMICGFLFGIVPGALIALAGATTGAAVVFSIGRWAAADVLARRAGPRLAGLADGFRRGAFGYVVVLRLLPVFPFWLTNLAPAAFGVGLPTFALATLVGLAPGAFVYAATGAAIEDVVAAHHVAKVECLAQAASDCENALSLSAFVTPRTVSGLAGLALFALASVALWHWFARAEPRRPA